MVALTQPGGLVDRMVGAALLESGVYEEVEHDQGAVRQAALVVVLAAIAAGIGVMTSGPLAFFVAVVAALVGWAAYAYVAYWVGTRWFKAPQRAATRGELLRTLGFASSPRLLLALGVIPVLGGVLSLVALVWALLTTVVAVRQALDLDIWPAAATAALSWLALFVISFVIMAALVAAPG